MGSWSQVRVFARVFAVPMVALFAAATAHAGDAAPQKALANPPAVTSVAIDCSMKSKGCGWGACNYDVVATNTASGDLPAGHTVRATITYKAINLSAPGAPGQVKTAKREKAVPRGGLPKGGRLNVGEFTIGKNTPGPASCAATAGP